MSVVIRSFQLTQKRKTLQFKALDGVIRYLHTRLAVSCLFFWVFWWLVHTYGCD